MFLNRLNSLNYKTENENKRTHICNSKIFQIKELKRKKLLVKKDKIFKLEKIENSFNYNINKIYYH